MAYTKKFINPYPDGWENLPSENTPITAEALQAYTDTMEAVEEQLVRTTEKYDDDSINLTGIHTIDSAGNAWFAGDVTDGNGDSIASIKEIALGAGSTAKVFGTKAELDEWLAVEGNSDTLSAGQDIYIVEIDTPDYWWDGTGLQILETEKVDLEDYARKEEIPVKTSELENDSGFLSEIPVATETSIGAVRPDGTSITIDENGILHAASAEEMLDNILGGAS